MTELKLHKDVHLGKKSASYDKRDLLYGEFIKTGVKLKPAAIGFGMDRIKQSWGMLGNDLLGDCAWASAAHETMSIRFAAGTPCQFTTVGVISDYSAATGYNPNDPNSDQGTDMHDEMSYRFHTGIIDSNKHRHKIGAYVALEPGNYEQHLEALAIFDAVAIGIEFPDYAMDQFNQGKPWTVRAGGTIEGGHAIPIVARSSLNYIEIVTWGRSVRMGRGFLNKYNDESYAYLTVDSLNAITKKTAEGYNMSDLIAAVKAI